MKKTSFKMKRTLRGVKATVNHHGDALRQKEIEYAAVRTGLLRVQAALLAENEALVGSRGKFKEAVKNLKSPEMYSSPCSV